MQGFLFSAPRRNEEITQLIRTRLDQDAASIALRRQA
jgi:hypothetical protein